MEHDFFLVDADLFSPSNIKYNFYTVHACSQSGSCRSMGTEDQCPELAFKNKTKRILGV